MTFVGKIIAIGFVLTLAVSNANAQGLQCGKRVHMVKTLEKRFKETRFAMGLANSINMLEVFVSKRGSWTILSTRANGTACIVAAGKSWINMPTKPVGNKL